MTPLRRAAIEGLRHAARFVDYFGWEACGPDAHLHIYAHLNVAAGKSGLKRGERAEDVQGLMCHMLTQHLGAPCLFDWEAESGRKPSDVRDALLSAARHP